MNIKKDKRGVAALLVIVIVSAAVLTMAFSASLLGLGELDMGWTSQKGAEALALTDGCVEEALLRLKLDSGYSGETLNIGSNSCIISVAVLGDDRTITVSGTVDDFNKKIQATATLNNGVLTLNTWQEVEN